MNETQKTGKEQTNSVEFFFPFFFCCLNTGFCLGFLGFGGKGDCVRGVVGGGCCLLFFAEFF